VILLLVLLTLLAVAGGALPTPDVLLMTIGIVFGSIGLMVGGAAYFMAWLANRRAKKAEASGRRVDAELSGPEGEPSMRQLLVENYAESIGARKAAVAAESSCLELKREITTTGNLLLGEINRLDGKIEEVATTARTAAAKATEALQVVRAIEHEKRRATDSTVVAAATNPTTAEAS
jgi:hypothetical protein